MQFHTNHQQTGSNLLKCYGMHSTDHILGHLFPLFAICPTSRKRKKRKKANNKTKKETQTGNGGEGRR